MDGRKAAGAGKALGHLPISLQTWGKWAPHGAHLPHREQCCLCPGHHCGLSAKREEGVSPAAPLHLSVGKQKP